MLEEIKAPRFYVEVFNSRNTAQEITCFALDVAHAVGKSSSYGKYTITNSDGFETYETDKINDWKCTEWSYPNGLGQIKVNS